MTEQKSSQSSFPDLPSHYWSTLTHHGHPSPTKLLLETELVRLSEIHVDSSRHDAAYFSDFSKHERMISPSTRTCSSLLSEMLRPSADSHASSPATTHVDTMSDHGSCSMRSIPSVQASPSKISVNRIASATPTIILQAAPKPARHISFGNVVSVSTTVTPETTLQPTASDKEKDYSSEATPVARRTFSYSSSDAKHEPSSRVVSTQSDRVSSDDQNPATLRPRAIRFAGSSTSQMKSVNSSRQSSYSEAHSATKHTDEQQSQSSTNGSPVLAPKVCPATCKSTLEAMLKKEQIAKVIETVPEEDDEDEGDDFDSEGEYEDDEDDDAITALEVDSDDDGYQEDVESDDDDDVYDEDEYAMLGTDSGTPVAGRFAPHHRTSSTSHEVRASRMPCKMYRTAAPSESDLPDTTDFAPGNMDEDQPACIAFDMAIRDREARRHPVQPSDIDPTFPESGSEEEIEQDAALPKSPTTTTTRQMCRSPPAQLKTAVRMKFNSPPLAKVFDLCRARSLPRRNLPSRKALYGPKPQRAVTIKQSNEQRAQRRREKKEVRHNMRRGVKVELVDHNGHEKMKVHCLSKKRIVAAENPCVIRPVMSI